MARHFEQSDDWENAVLTCPTCGWRGTFLEGDNEVYEALTDCSCPKCEWPDAPMLATVSHIVDAKKYFENQKREEGE
jgi:hypothetical protein